MPFRTSKRYGSPYKGPLVPTVKPIVSGSRVFTVNGSFAVTMTADMIPCKVTIVGAGAAGGGQTGSLGVGGGGGGGFASATLGAGIFTVGGTVKIVVGKGGVGVVGGQGGVGGQSNIQYPFNTYLVSGNGGSKCALFAPDGGGGGSASFSGNALITDKAFAVGGNGGTGTPTKAGNGGAGAAPLGGAGGVGTTTTVGGAGVAPGGGGGGCNNFSGKGGNGGDGYVKIEWPPA